MRRRRPRPAKPGGLDGNAVDADGDGVEVDWGDQAGREVWGGFETCDFRSGEVGGVGRLDRGHARAGRLGPPAPCRRIGHRGRSRRRVHQPG